ncbi:MAG: hypothetical protein WBK91_04110 [Alphaproteobacteria bacterium]
MSMRAQNALVLFKLESTPGVDALPTAANDAVAINNPKPPSFSPNIITTNEATGSLDGLGPIVGGMTMSLQLEIMLKGSGSPGVAPEWGKILKACGWAETLTATPVPGSPEACAAGGSTTLAVLGTSASSTAQHYRGMPLVLAGTVPGTSFISDYTSGKAATLTDTMGGAIVATTNYQVPANVLYSPASTGISAGTTYYYLDGILYKMLGARGTAKFELETNGVGKLMVNLQGMFGGKIDAAIPANPVFDATRPPIYLNGKCLINRTVAAASRFSLDDGIRLVFPDDPNATEGIQAPLHTARNMTGAVDPLETLVATRDIMTDLRAGTRRIIHTRYGQVVGNRIGLTVPLGQYLNQDPSDRNGLAQVSVPFACVGRDAGAFLCVY